MNNITLEISSTIKTLLWTAMEGIRSNGTMFYIAQTHPVMKFFKTLFGKKVEDYALTRGVALQLVLRACIDKKSEILFINGGDDWIKMSTFDYLNSCRKQSIALAWPGRSPDSMEIRKSQKSIQQAAGMLREMHLELSFLCTSNGIMMREKRYDATPDNHGYIHGEESFWDKGYDTSFAPACEGWKNIGGEVYDGISNALQRAERDIKENFVNTVNQACSEEESGKVFAEVPSTEVQWDSHVNTQIVRILHDNYQGEDISELETKIPTRVYQ
jgi:hypothetical protein